MEPTDYISIVSLGFGLVALIFSLINYARENANIELYFYQMIDERERHMMSLDPSNEQVAEAYYHSVVSIANAYETICAQYLSFRIPRRTFRIMYKEAIIQTVESKTFKDIYSYEQTSLLNDKEIKRLPFPNTMKVYKKFKNKGH